MNPGRKLTFQLTPLLDLLLIVIFAQYLEVESLNHRTNVAQAASQQKLTTQLNAALLQLTALQTQLTELELEADVAKTRVAESQRLRVQRDLIGQLVLEMFRVPEAALAQVLQRKAAAGPGPATADVRELEILLQQLAGGTTDRVVEHLLTFGEMRKRIDLWELFLSETGDITLVVGDRKQRFRAETAEDLRLRLYEAYKTLPESKGMVLILLSYGDVRFRSLKSTLEGLPEAISQIRLDLGPRARLEYAVLGYRPEGSR